MTDAPRGDVVAAVQRWIDAGGTWSVVSRDGGVVIVSLRTCDGGEEMQRLVTDDPVVRAWILEREKTGLV